MYKVKHRLMCKTKTGDRCEEKCKSNKILNFNIIFVDKYKV